MNLNFDYMREAEYTAKHGYLAMLKEFHPDEYIELLEEREADRIAELNALKEKQPSVEYPAFIKFINGIVLIIYAFISWGLSFFATYQLWDIFFSDGLFILDSNQTAFQAWVVITLIGFGLWFCKWIVVSIWRNTWITK